ncbi:MAG TPA: phosphate ABC transporter permease PstA [Candidatus Dormibacteraeota bacterium]|nr:phosphate ABC transporter permease PstA [Candidatus Dormibacteraeota bacterium]
MGMTAAEINASTLPPPGGRLLRRRLADYAGWGLCTLAFLFLGSATVWILAVVFMRGFRALTPQVLTHVTVGYGGGLLNAIEGTLVLAVGGILLAIPPGLASGIYLSEFGQGRLAPVIRFLVDVLVGVPSIVVGYFSYVTMVVGLGWKFSVAAGSIALAIIALPYICRTSEMALRQVPRAVREGAYALGAGDGRVAMGICVPMALPGILTGVLLALAIAVGETAPLIYTAGWSNYLWTGHLTNEPIGYLTYAIWAFITEPFTTAHELAYAAALFVTLFVLLISILARMALDENVGWLRRGRR